MENYPIKSVTFGGFDKQDVIRYIEQTAKNNEAAQKELLEEAERLRAQLDELNAANAALRAELEELSAQKQDLEAELSAQQARVQELTPLLGLDTKVAHLESELELLRPDAANYAQFRDRLGSIECEARERAAFRSQYATLMSTFETTASHVNAELRKVEVNLTQLPRAMDRSGVELEELAKQLES